VTAAATLQRRVDPDHDERLQQSCVLQRAAIDWLKAERGDQLHYHRFLRSIVPRHRHERLHRVFHGPGPIACARRVEGLEDEGARCPACDLFAGGGVEAEDELQAIRILPTRLPRPLTAACVADQGVAITTISASLTDSAGALTRCLGSAAYFGSAGLRKPQITSSPCWSQA